MTDYQVRFAARFTARRFADNPCGVVTYAEGLNKGPHAGYRARNDPERNGICRAFEGRRLPRAILPAANGDSLAGHLTIATMFTLAEKVIELQVDADGDDPTPVRIAGTAVTLLTGTITV